MRRDENPKVGDWVRFKKTGPSLNCWGKLGAIKKLDVDGRVAKGRGKAPTRTQVVEVVVEPHLPGRRPVWTGNLVYLERVNEMDALAEVAK